MGGDRHRARGRLSGASIRAAFVRAPTHVIPRRCPCALRSPIPPAVSLRSTAGYPLAPLPGCWGMGVRETATVRVLTSIVPRKGSRRQCRRLPSPQHRHPARRRGMRPPTRTRDTLVLFPGGVASLNRRLPAGTPAGVLGEGGRKIGMAAPVIPREGAGSIPRAGNIAAAPTRANARDAPADAHARYVRPFRRRCRFAQPPATGWHPCRGAGA